MIVVEVIENTEKEKESGDLSQSVCLFSGVLAYVGDG